MVCHPQTVDVFRGEADGNINGPKESQNVMISQRFSQQVFFI